VELPKFIFGIGGLTVSGKNQDKRRLKNIAHAEKVWTKVQIQAAQAKTSLDSALELIRDKKEELTEEQFALVEQEAKKRYAELEQYVLTARDNFVAKMSEYSK
jgi:hypothetical protein